MRRFSCHAFIAAVAIAGVLAACSGGTPSPVDAGPATCELAISPESQDFGKVDLGTTTTTFSFTLSNRGQRESSVPVVSLGGADAASFKIADSTCTAALASGKSCTVSVNFTPSNVGPSTASLDFNFPASPTCNSSSVALTGTGSTLIAGLSVSSALQDYGSVNVGCPSSPVSFVVTNVGGSSSGIPLAALSGADANAFSITSNDCTAAIPAGGSCTVGARFNPTFPGPKSATLAVTATPGNTVTVTLVGTGASFAPLSISPSPNDFGSVVTGAISPEAIFTVTNIGNLPTGTLSATLFGANATQFGLGMNTCTTLAVGAACTIRAHFSPTSPGAATASLNVAAAAGCGSTSAALTAVGVTAAQLSISPTSFDFGTVIPGCGGSVSFTVTNTGGSASGIPTASLGGANASDFSITSNNCTAALPASGTCSVAVAFSPTSLGTKIATLTVAATPGGAVTGGLSGLGILPAPLSISPSPNDFGAVVTGATSPEATFTVTNSGCAATGPITVALSGANAAQFGLGLNTCTALAAGATCTIQAHFSPTSAAAAYASLNVTAFPGGLASASLTGDGI